MSRHRTRGGGKSADRRGLVRWAEWCRYEWERWRRANELREKETGPPRRLSPEEIEALERERDEGGRKE
jgi:hypothetical protein